jgi:hypothetical protein
LAKSRSVGGFIQSESTVRQPLILAHRYRK